MGPFSRVNNANYSIGGLFTQEDDTAQVGVRPMEVTRNSSNRLVEVLFSQLLDKLDQTRYVDGFTQCTPLACRNVQWWR